MDADEDAHTASREAKNHYLEKEMKTVSSDSDKWNAETNRNNEMIEESLCAKAGPHRGNYGHDLCLKDQLRILCLAVVHDNLDMREGRMA